MDSKITRALLVEDNPGDALLIRIHLQDGSHGVFELEHVERLAAALRRLGERPGVDVVLLDLSLPDANGLDGLARVHAEFPDLPVVVLTGLDDESMAIRALRMGAQDYLVKGQIDGSLLRRAIRYTLERKVAEIERVQLRHELSRRERLAAIGQTVASVMHSIKNVMTRMVSSERLIDQMLNQNKGPNEKVLEIWPIMRRATNDLNAYVKNMLNFSRDHTIDMEPRNLNEVAVGIFQLCREDAGRLGIDLTLALEEEMPFSYFDQHLINDAALNLVTNALEAVSGYEGPAVEIRTVHEPDNNRVIFQVTDNGPGIPDGVRERVFDPFFTTKGAKGNGLGLAMAQKSVVAHNGLITVDTRPGCTLFQIYLPVEPHMLQVAAV